MPRSRVLSSLLLSLAACSSESALELRVMPVTGRPDSCIEVSVGTPGGDALSDTEFVTDGGASYSVLVYQGTTFPEEVQFTVRAWVSDAGCAAPRWSNGEIGVPGRFTRGITVVEARLDQLPDSDGDQTVDAVDCAPDAGARGQSLPERCNTRQDADCDGFMACDDPDCAAQPCAQTLVLLDGGATTAGACVAQTVTLTNAGEPLLPSAPVSVVLSDTSNNDVTFFSGPGCSGPSGTLNITAPSTYFWLQARRAGALTFSASATSFLSATASYTVTAGAPASVSLDAGVATATNCTPISATWADEFNNPIVGAPMQVSSADTSVFADGTCAQSGAFTTGSPVFIQPDDEGDVTVSVNAGAASGSITVRTLRPFAPGMLTRWPLVVHTFENPPFNGYDGYTVATAVDASVPDGQLRVFFWQDAGWLPVPRVAAQGTVGFALLTDLDAGVDDRRYAVVAMDPTLDEALDDLDAVYLFADDFDDPSLSKWWQRDGGYTQQLDAGFQGTGALFFAQGATATNNFIQPTTPLYERDVRVCSRWRRETDSKFDFAQLVRLQPSSDEDQELNRETSHWVLASQTSAGTWSGYGSNINGGLADWDVVCVAEWETADGGTFLAGWSNGALLGTRDITSNHSGPGTVGYRRHKTQDGAAWFDNFRARRFVLPEPSVTVSAPVQAPP